MTYIRGMSLENFVSMGSMAKIKVYYEGSNLRKKYTFIYFHIYFKLCEK